MKMAQPDNNNIVRLELASETQDAETDDSRWLRGICLGSKRLKDFARKQNEHVVRGSVPTHVSPLAFKMSRIKPDFSARIVHACLASRRVGGRKFFADQ